MQAAFHESLDELLFQSTPAPKGGRCVRGQMYAGFGIVSIHTRPERRAMPPQNLLDIGRSKGGFNPHPPRKAGDATKTRQLPVTLSVSIHTRPERRAMR